MSIDAITLNTLNQAFPIGFVAEAPVAPSSAWLALDGSSYLKASYPALAPQMSSNQLALAEASFALPYGAVQQRVQINAWRRQPDGTTVGFGSMTGNTGSQESRVAWGTVAGGWKSSFIPASGAGYWDIYRPYVCGSVVVMGGYYNTTPTYRIIKSTNAGASFTQMQVTFQPLRMACDATGSNFLASDGTYLYWSTDGGMSWQQTRTFGAIGTCFVQAVEWDSTTNEWWITFTGQDSGASNWYKSYIAKTTSISGTPTWTTYMVHSTGGTAGSDGIGTMIVKRGNLIATGIRLYGQTQDAIVYSPDNGVTWYTTTNVVYWSSTSNGAAGTNAAGSTTGNAGYCQQGFEVLNAMVIFPLADGSALQYATAGGAPVTLCTLTAGAHNGIIGSANYVCWNRGQRVMVDTSKTVTNPYNETANHGAEFFAVYDSSSGSPKLYTHGNYEPFIRLYLGAGDDGNCDCARLLDQTGRTIGPFNAYTPVNIDPYSWTDGTNSYVLGSLGEVFSSPDGVNLTTRAAKPFNLAWDNYNERAVPQSCFLGPQSTLFAAWKYWNASNTYQGLFISWQPTATWRNYVTATGANVSTGNGYYDLCGNGSFILAVAGTSTISSRNITGATALNAYLSLTSRSLGGVGNMVRCWYLGNTWFLLDSGGALYAGNDNADPNLATFVKITTIPNAVIAVGYAGGITTAFTATHCWKTGNPTTPSAWTINPGFLPPGIAANTFIPRATWTMPGYTVVGGYRLFAVSTDGVNWAFFDVTTLADVDITQVYGFQGPSFIAITSGRYQYKFTVTASASGTLFLMPAIQHRTPGMAYFARAK